MSVNVVDRGGGSCGESRKGNTEVVANEYG